MYLRCLNRLTDNTNQHLYLNIAHTLKAKKRHTSKERQEKSMQEYSITITITVKIQI
jgi:hypothetical protein